MTVLLYWRSRHSAATRFNRGGVNTGGMTVKRLIALFAIFLIAGCNQPTTQASLVVTGATVIDVRDGARIADAVVVVDSGRISAVGPASDTPIPTGARIVDARGKYVIPGLWDVHVHIQNQRELDVFFPLLIAHGIVGIRDANGLLPREFRELGKQHRYVPHVVASGPAVDGPAPAGVADAAIVDELADKGVDFIKIFSMVPRERYFAIAARAKERGLQIAGHVPIAVSASEASDAGLKTMEHVEYLLLSISSREDELRAARVDTLSGLTTFVDQVLVMAWPPIEPYLSNWSDEKASALFEKFVTNQTWQTPTLELFRIWSAVAGNDSSFWNNPNLTLMPKDWVDSWHPDRNQVLSKVPPAELPNLLLRMRAWYQSELDLTRRMHAAGVGLLAGTDVSNWNFMVPGLSLHDELARFVEAGLTPLEALQTATINPALYLSIDGETATVGAGKRADFLILEADPTENIANTKRISAVVLGGSLIDRSELDGMLEASRQRASETTAK